LSRTVPSKIQAYLAAGRPILASMDGEGARVVQAAGAGLACAAEDAAALAAAAQALRDLPPEARQRMGEAGRRYYAEHYDPDRLARALVGHLTGAVAARNRQEKKLQ
jgi:glycosyltransferase involved in cell wall biosynthesis